MRDWKFWDWAAYGTLGASGVFLALREGIEKLPTAVIPELLREPILAFLPLIFFLLATLILILRGLGWIGSSNASTSTGRLDMRLAVNPEISPIDKKAETEIVREEERIFVGDSITPKYLYDFFEHNTSVQATKLTDAYLGKWMRITGDLSQVSVFGEIRRFAQVTFKDMRSPTVFLIFDEKWIDRLSILKRGDRLTIIGKLDRIDAATIQLNHCEIVGNNAGAV